MLLAVHIADGVLKPGWLAAGFAGTGLLFWLGARRLREVEIPRIALLTAVFFVVTTIHVKVGGATSVHLLGNALVGVILGRRAGLAIMVGLFLQAFLDHGGLTALGVNCCVITIPALGAWFAFRGLHRLPWVVHPWGRALLVALAVLFAILSLVYGCTLLATNLRVRVEEMDLTTANMAAFHPLTLALALVLTGLAVWVERRMENAPEFPLGLLIGEMTVQATLGLNFLALALGGESDSAAPSLIMLAVHLPLSVIEGIVLGITLGFLMRVKPEMLNDPPWYEIPGMNLQMLEAIWRIIALTRKELLAMLKDPRARFSIFVPPMLQCLIYGYVASYDLNDIPYAVLDRDRSTASVDLLAKLDGSKIFHRVANLDRSTDVRKFIDEGRALLVLQIEPDFQRKLLLGQSAELQVVADGRNSNTAGTAVGYVGAVVETFNADWRADHPAAGKPRMADAANGTIKVVSRAWYNPNLETRWHMIPSLIGTLTMMGTLMLTALSVAREREQGTFDQLLVTPFRPTEIMAGKTLPAMLIGTVQASSVLLVAQLWFRIPFAGSFLVLYAGLTLFLLAAVGIGLLVSAFAQTMQQAMLYSFVIMMPFILMSGLTTPISSMPDLLQYVTLANPLRYAIEIVHRVYLEGAGLHLLWSELWPMAVIALATLSAASWMFRRGLE